MARRPTSSETRKPRSTSNDNLSRNFALAHPAKWIDAKPDEAVTDVADRSLKFQLNPVEQDLFLAARYADELIDQGASRHP